MNELGKKESLIYGQKYAFATVSLVLGITCFVNLLNLEKAILAIIFGWLALRSHPAPDLKEHRLWAKVGITLGIFMMIFIPLVVIFNFDVMREIIEFLSKLSSGK